MAPKKTPRIYTPIESMAHFAQKLALFEDRIAFRWLNKQHEILTMTYAELAERVRREAAGLAAAGLAGKRVAVIGETSVEWVTTYVSVVASGGVAIPMDRELDSTEIFGFLEIAEADAVVFSSCMNAKFAPLVEGHATVSRVIPISPDETMPESERVLPFARLMELGAAEAAKGYQFPKCENSDRMAEMLFTSGTTGSSKCVMLSERNIVTTVNAACETVNFSCEDRIVSVLPIHHTYELAIMIAGLNYGMNIAINDSLKRVLRNFALFQPTGLILVPLFVTTMNKKIWEEAKKSGKKGLLKMMLKVSHGLRGLNIDLRRKFFKSVNEAFGGSLCKIVCGGAPLNPEIADIFYEFGIQISEGYGITECSPLIAVNPYFAPKRGSVGPAVPSCTVRIDADHKNDKGFDEGEIVVKGTNVMLGYYKNPAATAEAFTADGWFRTGDVGYMDKDGYIYITGRKKFVIVLENGKNVFPEEIEEYIANQCSVAESVVLGRKAADGDLVLTAIVFPKLDAFKDTADHETIERTIRAEIEKMNKKLVSYKQIRNVEFRYTEFEKTTSKKIKRHLVN